MKPKKNQKLCHSCDGDVDLDVIVCPYCAADLRETAASLEEARQRQARSTASSRKLDPQQASDSLYPAAEARTEGEEAGSEKIQSLLVPTALFASGALLLFLSLFLFFFSHDGVLLLKWDARFWFLYFFASIPFLVFGYQRL